MIIAPEKTLKGLEENLKFLSLEVIKQLHDTRRVLDAPASSARLIEKIQSKDDYIDNMKNVIENKSNSYLSQGEGLDKKTVSYTRALTIISANLEHIADHAVDIVGQINYLKDPDFLDGYNYGDFFECINSASAMIVKALDKKDVSAALKICRCESEIDTLYKAVIARIIGELKNGLSAENLVTTLFIFQYLERMGDCLLNIGEAIISIALGERIKIHQLMAFEESFHGEISSGNNVVLESVGETRSGSTIRKVYDTKEGSDARWVIFKEGNADKLQKEKENIEKWGMIMPGIVPAVMGFNRNGGSASIVLEYLKGTSYKDIIVNGKMDFLKESFSTLTRDIRKVWLSTKQDFPVHGKYLEQLCSRLDDVYAVHPDFKSGKSMIGELETPPFDDIIKKILSVDKKTFAPFAVMIHGDFNIDNLIYDPNENCIRFIDLHRSVCGDYVQDVSVFILSNFRLPFFDRTIRKKINWAINEFFMFAADFADEQKDTEFEKRLALGLIRSFVTSTRFELDPEFSKLMYMKAVYLAEKLIEHEAEPGEIFRLPEEILTY